MFSKNTQTTYLGLRYTVHKTLCEYYTQKTENPMKCPKCHAETKNFRTQDSQQVNFCQGCGGTWFDKGELSKMIASDSDHIAGEKALQNGQKTGVACTACSVGELIAVKFHPAHEPVVDVCSSCHGIFLDAKEISKVEKVAATIEGGHLRLARAVVRMKEAGYLPIGIAKGK
jgi:Zn-finger nucleic acid-binding protein